MHETQQPYQNGNIPIQSTKGYVIMIRDNGCGRRHTSSYLSRAALLFSMKSWDVDSSFDIFTLAMPSMTTSTIRKYNTDTCVITGMQVIAGMQINTYDQDTGYT